ncbi:MAG: undecaprenyl-diphosphatase UppP [Acidobacteria bacterium]|nr:MAG: undecaprenyl-diphosphatase UppP [Acidobacteriota bacterium]
MPLYQAIVLAIVQGLAEFLPISSTAHLILFPWLLGWKDPGLTFDVALHVGTLAAVAVYFRRQWLRLGAAALGLGADSDAARTERRLFWFLVAGTIPGGIAGFLLQHAAEEKFRQPWLIGLSLLAVGLLMWAGDRTEGHEKSLERTGLADALWIGLAQAFAVVPGVSRSGATMTAGLFRGMTREASARFSFLLATPIITGAALVKGFELRHEGLAPEMRLPFFAGIVVSGLVGYLVVAFLLRYLAHRTFKIFVIYRLALGVVVLLLGWLSRHA